VFDPPLLDVYGKKKISFSLEKEPHLFFFSPSREGIPRLPLTDAEGNTAFDLFFLFLLSPFVVVQGGFPLSPFHEFVDELGFFRTR